MTGEGQPRSPEFTDGLVHLAAALQRVGCTMSGIEHLPPHVIHRIARALDTAPVPEHLQHPPEDAT